MFSKGSSRESITLEWRGFGLSDLLNAARNMKIMIPIMIAKNIIKPTVIIMILKVEELIMIDELLLLDELLDDIE